LRNAARCALRAAMSDGTAVTPDGQSAIFERLIGEMERTLIEETLKITNGNQVAAARLLGLHRTTLRNKLK
jgi:two-component system nitrogen regulation response regulator GlnG